MNKKNIPILSITLGDPCGIGPEIVAKTLYFLEKKKINILFKVIGSKSAFVKATEHSKLKANFNNIEEFINFDGKFHYACLFHHARLLERS